MSISRKCMCAPVPNEKGERPVPAARSRSANQCSYSPSRTEARAPVRSTDWFDHLTVSIIPENDPILKRDPSRNGRRFLIPQKATRETKRRPHLGCLRLLL